MNRFLFFQLLSLSLFAVASHASAASASSSDIFQKADSALAQGFSSALKKPLEKIASDPRSPLDDRQAALARLAQICLQSDTPADILPLFLRIPSTPSLDFWKAQLLFAKGETAAAITAFLSVANTPDHPFQNEAKIGASRALARQAPAENLPAITQLLTSISPSSPLYPQAILDLAQIYLEQDLAEEASTKLTNLTDIPPRLQTQHTYLLAQSLFARGDFFAALHALDRVAPPGATPSEKITLLRANCWNELGNPDRAIDLLEEYLQQSPSHTAATLVFRRLDDLYSNQPSPSLATLRRIANSPTPSPQTANALFFLAKTEAHLDHAAEAKNLYSRFLEQYPNHPSRPAAATALSAIHLENNEPAKALDLVTPYPHDPDANFLRGQALVLLGRYAEAASAFSLAMQTPALRMDAAYNGAISSLLAGSPPEKNPFLPVLRSEDPSGYFLSEFLLADALESARKRLPAAGEKLADLVPVFTNRASTPLAEWHFVQLDTAAARSVLDASPSSPNDEQRACLEVFLADDETSSSSPSENSAETLAKKFLKDFPKSEKASQVRLKLAEIAYRRGDFLTARSNFDLIASDSSDPNLAAHAWFLAGKSSSKLMTQDALQQAMLCYESAAKIGGELAARSRFEQALLLNAQKEHPEAIVLLDRVLSDSKDPDLRAATLIEKGDTYFATTTPHATSLAIKTWKTLIDSPETLPYWKEQAATKVGIALEKSGDKDAALESFYSVLLNRKNGDSGDFWFDRAGFEAGRLLEDRKAWKEAIRVYQRIAESSSPRAEEAKKRANRLRLENFLWED